jgi:hypothetical protein
MRPPQSLYGQVVESVGSGFLSRILPYDRLLIVTASVTNLPLRQLPYFRLYRPCFDPYFGVDAHSLF